MHEGAAAVPAFYQLMCDRGARPFWHPQHVLPEGWRCSRAYAQLLMANMREFSSGLMVFAFNRRPYLYGGPAGYIAS